MMSDKQKATFGGGCFWCVEAVVQRLKGIKDVVSGYSGGQTKNPTYREICSGTTGHAEVIQVTFDSEVISYEDLITIFMTSHDPTTLNRQGADRGTQYRSIILYHDEDQKEVAERVLKGLKDSFTDPIVTEIVPLDTFYPAENYHQNYYNNNSYAGYCRVVISPKIKKLNQMYADRLREEVT
ncbi:MAG: peptide-methionine (S)-S-oxide reductase MsrA [Saprospiraceae bacterium]|nr:peptide-methionine (S)-S-oxide reductase MsrA [Saprospiraceae bacterium]